MAALPIEHAQVKQKIEELIERDGLETVTSSKIRAHLKSVFDVDFSDCKKAVDEVTMTVINTIQNKGKETKDNNLDSDDSDIEPAPSTKEDDTSQHIQNTQGSSSSDDSDHGLASTERARPVKKATKRKAADTDDSNLDLMSAIKTGRRAAAKQAANNLRKIGGWRSKEKEGKKKEPGKITKATKLVYCSEELQGITGQKFMRRCDVVKAMWAYVREHDRMDPKDKRFAIIEGDANLERVFKGKRRLQMFGVMGHLGHRHLMNPVDVSTELVDECEAFKDQLIAEYEAKSLAGNDGSDEEDNNVEESEEKPEANNDDEEKAGDSDSD